MSKTSKPAVDPNKTVTYPMRWPRWLRDKVAAAAEREAQARAQPANVAAWLRDAAMEKLERDEGLGR